MAFTIVMVSFDGTTSRIPFLEAAAYHIAGVVTPCMTDAVVPKAEADHDESPFEVEKRRTVSMESLFGAKIVMSDTNEADHSPEN